MATPSQAFLDLRQFLSRRLKGPFITALLEALATGDELNSQNILAVKENLFITTASGVFLDKLLARIGVTRPPGVGIDDNLLRQLAIKQTSTKLVRNIFLDVLEVFYGEDAVRANTLSGLPEKYILADGMTLSILVDTNPNPLTIVFKAGEFANIALATAEEVANAISNSAFAQNSTLTASVVVDQGTGLPFVQLMSGTRGPQSAITVIGGSAQNILKFPTEKGASAQIGTQFTTSFVGSNVRFTWTGGPDPQLNYVDVGDYVNIFGTGYLPANQGTYTIQNVQGGALSQAFFEILNPLFKQQAPVTLSGVNSISGNGTVSRQMTIADAPTGAVRASNVVTITTTMPHNLSPGQSVRIANVDNASFEGVYTILSAGTNTFTYSQSGQNTTSGGGSVFQEAQIAAVGTGAVRSSGVSTITTTTNHGYITGEIVTIDGVEDSSFDGPFTVTSAGSNTFTYAQNFSNDITFFKPSRITVQELARYASVYEVNPYEVVIFLPATTRIVKRNLIGSWHVHGTNTQTNFLGSYTYDTHSLPISKVSTTLQEPINEGSLETVIFGLNTNAFPDGTGYLMFDFGTDNQEGPVKYLARPSSGSLLVDPSYKFQKTHAINSDVMLLLGRTGYQPKQDGTDYQAFVTGTTAGRDAAIAMMESLAAAGIFLNIFIVYPKDPGLVYVDGWVYGNDTFSDT